FILSRGSDDGFQKWVFRSALAAMREDDEHWNGFGLNEQVPEHAHGVPVGPLQIVYVQDDRTTITNAREQFAERAKCPLLEIVRVGHHFLGSIGNDGNAVEHGEETCQREDLAR